MAGRVLLLLFLLTVACTPSPSPTASPASAETDAALEAAIQQARATLDLFIQKIGTPHPARTQVALKVRFTLPAELPQDVWVDEILYTEGSFRGTMGDDIPSLRLSLGDRVTIEREEIVDWAIVQEGKLVGGYTIRLAVQRMTPEEKARFLETLPYAIED